MKLKQEEKRIKIAKACGWRLESFAKRGSDGGIHAKFPVYYFTHQLPDYFNDLNACHELEMSMTEEQRTEFREILSDMYEDECRLGLAFHATAAHRAEAFGLTLKLWEA